MSLPSTSDTEAFVADSEILVAAQHVKRLTFLAYGGILAIFLALGAYFFNFRGPLSDKPESWGQFGDYLGGILNPTFSYLALIALLATFSLQVRELRISAKELKNSADALTKQHETMHRQSFEATFFQMMTLLNDIANGCLSQDRNLIGRECFKAYVDDIEVRIIKAGGSSNLRESTKNPTILDAVYDEFYEVYGTPLGPYFRVLYNIVKFIDVSDLHDRKFYSNLVRAQLSSVEVKLIFYSCLTNRGLNKFKPLVERYALLKAIPTKDEISEALFKQYSPDAFGGSYPAVWER